MNHPRASSLSGAAESAHEAKVRQWNATTKPYPREASLAELFGRWSRENAYAVIDGQRQLSYAELDWRANAVAYRLVEHGVDAGQRVGVLARRSLEAIVAIVGIVKAGAVYVPLDTEYPLPRLEAMADDAEVSVVLSHMGAVTRLPKNIGDVLYLDEDLMSHAPNISRTVTGEDLAYVMFTSGSTGRPKAVGVRHRGISRLVLGTDYITFNPGDRVLHTASLSFDASTFEIWGALLNGACLIVADSQLLLSPRDLEHLFATRSITTAFITTAIFHYLAGQQPSIFKGLRNLVVGGEALNPDLARKVLANQPPQRVINGYGPTENTTFTTAYLVNDLPAEAKTMPIGTAISNTTCYVLRDDGSLADIGEKGELVAGGDGIAAGYLNDAALTAERFIPNPFNDNSPASARLYRTGDFAAWRADGTIDYRGRRDAQFKIHGHRIDAAEIEGVLLRHPAIVGAVVTRDETHTAGDAQLIAYLVTADDHETPSTTDLRELLARDLPSYMIPAVFITLERLPLSPSGKIDRTALPAPPDPALSRPGIQSASSEQQSKSIQEQVRDIWNEVLRSRGVEPTIEPEDSLFNVGGTSFDAVEIHACVSELFNVPDLTPLDLFTYPTLRRYTEHLASLVSLKAD
jgi:amino acid adenylation domain-containing protein